MTSTTASPTDLADLAARTTGRVLGPADPGFAGLSTPWNAAAASAPVAVVGLALARLDLLAGDLAAAAEHLAGATGLARRAGGAGALLRCRLLAVRLAERRGGRPEPGELDAITEEAARRGMAGVAREAGERAAAP
jgi:hypothetical protein